jgi:hypothetical protein
MKTLLLSTFIQLLFSITIFTILFAATMEPESFQISIFAFGMLGLIIPLSVFNFFGFAVLKTTVNKIKSANPKRTVLLATIIFGLVISILLMLAGRPKNFFGVTSAAAYFIVQFAYIFTMTAILHFYFVRDFANDINAMKEE